MIGNHFYISVRTLRRLSVVASVTLLFSVSMTPSVSAISTIKASALQLNLEAINNNTSSFTSSSPSAQAVSCLPLLKQVRLSPDGSDLSQSQRSAGITRASMPVTLGFLIGVRVALGPKEVVKKDQRVQVGPEILQRYDTGESYALAVADYRRCKQNIALQK